MSSFDANAPPTDTPGPDVASAAALSRFEQVLESTANSFHKWTMRGMALAGHSDLSPLAIMILNIAAQSAYPRTMADICLVLGIEDVHLARYAIQKLTDTGLITTGRLGKEKTVVVTEDGAAASKRFHAIRNRLLNDAIASATAKVGLTEITSVLRAASGAYDQARHSAASW